MIVMKFGGTSTQDAESMLNVMKIIKSRIGESPVVVVSAIAQATNVLEEAGAVAADGREDEAQEGIRELIDRHMKMAGSLISSGDRRNSVTEFIRASHEGLKTLLHGIHILKELTPRTLDSLYCHGELLSSRIMTAVLQENGINAEWLDTKDFMITDGSYNRAQPLFILVEKNLRNIVMPMLSRKVVPVTQGFIGITEGGMRTTMGRESSDYSASIIGSLLNADDIQIWTDVDGVLTADPRIVPDPKKVKVLAFEEAYELSYFGAKVLHPNTMLPAVERNIPIRIFNSRKPELPGTLVTKRPPLSQAIVKSIAFKRNVSLITVAPKARYSPYIFWEHIQSILTKYNAVAGLTSTSEYNYSFILDEKNEVSSILHELSEIGIVGHVTGRGIISLIGSRLRNFPDLLIRLFSAMGRLDVSMISFGSSASSFSFVVADSVVPDIVRRIHTEFFSKDANSEIFASIERVKPPD